MLAAFTDPNEPKSEWGGGSNYLQGPFGNSGEAIPFTFPEDLMKNLPKALSNMFGAGGGMPGDSPTFKIIMKEYDIWQ